MDSEYFDLELPEDVYARLMEVHEEEGHETIVETIEMLCDFMEEQRELR